MTKMFFEPLNGKRISEKEFNLRYAHIESLRVVHPKFSEIKSEVTKIHNLSKANVKAEQLCIIGQTGAGKSSIIELYASKYPHVEEEERTHIPVLLVSVPPRAKSPRVLASKILREMKDQFFDSGSEEHMTHRICNYVDKCDIKMIFLDEFHHLIDRDTDYVLASASDWLKTFIDKVKIPVVLVGLPESERIFSYNEQLDGRYPNRMVLPPFSYSSKKDIIEFRRFLVSIDDKLPLSELSNLSDPELAAKIFYFSFGVPRYVMNLLKSATEISLNKGKDLITEIELRDAFNRITRSTRPYAINPFENTKFHLMDEIEKEKKIHEQLFQSEPKKGKRK
ncbi:TniB family NTP-binding protein [Paenibacillus typhae]|uniref:TniB protein n=1 Tax=Paenibacillus typhae TaxID=1174501 RepID=A0A1G8F6K4_9BACL|nr:TniB family NTP-binding protein [Paenibacillus typhae]SDH77741.1 TniB protein [Paenibacillus typhae]